MLRDKGFILLLLLVLALLLVPFVHGEDEPGSHARIVRLSFVVGHVQIAHQQGGGYENATMNVPLVQGDQLRTGNDGWVEVQLENGSTIRLAPESDLTFVTLTRFPSGATATEVNFDSGEGEFAVAAGDDDGPFRINVRQRVISLKHSSRFRVTTLKADPLEITVWKGEVGVFSSDSGQEVAVKKHEVFMLDPEDAGHYDLEKDVQADDLDQWSAERDQYLSSYAPNNNTAQSPYQYGMSDLNYYGQYYNVVGCNNCWQPYGVGLGWDPFMNGYWNNSSYGYAWVSAYPWGWMPYRFGQWVFVPGFGWLWQPGWWNRWVSIPRVVNPPAGFRPPVAPTAAGAMASITSGKPGIVTKFDGGPARLTVNNPALSTTIGKGNREVISNEHVPASFTGQTGNSVGAGAAPTKPGPAVVRVRPPVQPPQPMGAVQQPRVVNTPPPQVHVSSPPVSRPQTFSPPPRAYSPPPAPAAAPPAHSGSHH